MSRATLSIVRPGVMPAAAPRGRATREIRQDGWADHPGWGLTPQQVLAIFRLAEQGFVRRQCDLFDDLIENDAHLRNLLEQRAQAVAGKPFTVQAGGVTDADDTAALVLSAALNRLPMIEFLEHQLSFNRYGYACSEIDWDWAELPGLGRWIVPVWFANVRARRFVVDAEHDALRLITSDNESHGEPLVDGKWVITRRSGATAPRAALMRTATWSALWKRFATRDWVVYAEKFGVPLILAKYAENTDDAGKDVAAEIVEKIGDDGGAVVSDGITVEVVEAGRNGDSSSTHGGLIAFCNREMSKLVNGSTLANDNSDSGGASYALGEVHDSVRWEAVQYDAERIQESFRTQVAAAFVRFNGLDAAAPLLKLQVVRDLAPRPRADMADILQNKLGIKVSIDQLRQELGFLAPNGDDDAAPGAPAPTAPLAAEEP